MVASNFNMLTVAFNGLALTLALAFLLVILWLNPRSQLNLFFFLFTLMAITWTVGTILSHAIAFVGGNESLIGLGVRLLEVGFAGACIGVYLFTAALVRPQGRFFLIVAVAGFLVVLAYQGVLLLGQSSALYTVDGEHLTYSFGPFSTALYFLFEGATALLLWLQRRRVRERTILTGIALFVTAQAVGLLNPYLRSLAAPTLLGNVGVLVISLGLVRQQIMSPLIGRASQLEAVREVGLAITSRLRLEEVLSSIAGQVRALLGADGAAIYLQQSGSLELAAVDNMPSQFVGHRLMLGQGVAGKVALEKQAIRLDDYALNWSGDPDVPLARSTFGSVVAAPLVFGGQVQGVLLVVQGRQGKIFNREDVHLLELLGPQAAVAIANSELFERQRGLADALTAAKSQLETVLTSTESPVLALDRSLRIIFANPAVGNLLASLRGRENPIPSFLEGWSLLELTSAPVLPPDVRAALRVLRQRRTYVYELELAERTFMCHTATLGYPRITGWVAVLNDITELKALDRFKSQMVRMTSHDLKNPLFAAMSYLELLEEELPEDHTGEIDGYIETIFKQLERMSRTISNILDLERVEAGVPVHELCALPPLIEDAVDELSAQATSHNLTLESTIDDTLPLVLGDRQQLVQVFLNLIENAIKYTLPGGNVCVQACSQDGGVIISVRDTGVGIPRELHERVFERFFRAQQPGVEHVRGSGLGLSLVKAIVSAHHGTVRLESAPGQGTTVSVWLPAYVDERDGAECPPDAGGAPA